MSKSGLEVSGSGGPILIFGWIVQFGYALAPYLFTRFLEPGKPARLGGTWLSLAAVMREAFCSGSASSSRTSRQLRVPLPMASGYSPGVRFWFPCGTVFALVCKESRS
jgi:hypothetical protein